MNLKDYEKFARENITQEETLRTRRANECFIIYNQNYTIVSDEDKTNLYSNRGNFITQAQLDEMKLWYFDWLDVTITLTVPTKPSWLV